MLLASFTKRILYSGEVNRVDNPHFPDTISEVIWQKNQYAGMYGDRITRCYVMDELVKLVEEELENRTDYDVVFFNAGHYSDYESDWAAREVALASQKERESAEDKDDWDYGVACYESALRAYRSLERDGHSGMSIQITKSILNRLIDGKCLTPIEDDPDIWTKVEFGENDPIQHFQCKRMSSLFKDVTEDGTVTYSDVNRVQLINKENS